MKSEQGGCKKNGKMGLDWDWMSGARGKILLHQHFQIVCPDFAEEETEAQSCTASKWGSQQLIGMGVG